MDNMNESHKSTESNTYKKEYDKEYYVHYDDENADKNIKRTVRYKHYIMNGLSLFGAIALAVVLYFFLYNMDNISSTIGKIFNILMPFIIGIAIAYIISPMCEYIEKIYNKLLKNIKMISENKRKSIAFSSSVFSGMLITFILIYILLIILIPQIINSIVRFVQVLPGEAEKFGTMIYDKLNSNAQLQSYAKQIIDKAYAYVNSWLSEGSLGVLQNFATQFSTGIMNFVSILFNILIGFIVAIYVLFQKKKLVRQGEMVLYSIVKKKFADFIKEELKFADKVFSGFIYGKIVDAVVISVICYIGMILFKVITGQTNTMSEILIAVIVGIFNIIPFFGWYIGLFVSAFLILIINPVQCIFFIIFDFILQQIDGNIIGPKILGDSTGLSGFWVLFAILFFGGIWGFVGMLIGVPIFAVIYHMISQLVSRGLRRHGRMDMIEQYNRDFPAKESRKEDK